MTTDRIAAYYANGGGQGGHSTRAVTGMQLSNGAFPIGKGWDRYNPDGEKVWVTDLYGRDRWLTRGQIRLYQLLLTLIDAGTVKMRDLAEKLGVAPSTVSRGMTKLMAYGLIAYVSGRGRYGGTLILRRVRGDTLERLARTARARVRRWWETAQRRLSRLDSNVASYRIMEEGIGESVVVSNGRNIRNWTPQELRDAGIL